jgi:hypothetical protein
MSDAATPCPKCGTVMVADQRYCLECGEPRMPMSSFLFGAQQVGGASAPTPSSPPATPPNLAPVAGGVQRNNTLTVIAGVGVLLLAMGVGVLIGRSSAPKQSAAPAQTISVTAPAAAAGAGAAAGAAAATPEAASKAGSSASKAGSKKGASSTGASKSGVGSSEAHPAPPTVVQNLAKKKGKNYEQESKNLPNVISTG